MVFKLLVISSPSLPSPLERPFTKFPFLYINEAEMPSIFGSALYEISKPSFFDRKFEIFFQNLSNLPLKKHLQVTTLELYGLPF